MLHGYVNGWRFISLPAKCGGGVVWRVIYLPAKRGCGMVSKTHGMCPACVSDFWAYGTLGMSKLTQTGISSQWNSMVRLTHPDICWLCCHPRQNQLSSARIFSIDFGLLINVAPRMMICYVKRLLTSLRDMNIYPCCHKVILRRPNLVLQLSLIVFHHIMVTICSHLH
jgi:hypothetical protein